MRAVGVRGIRAKSNMRLAFEELDFFSRYVKLLGTYPEHPYRRERLG